MLEFSRVPVARKFLENRGGGESIKTFHRNFFFVPQCRKFS